jgi:hypothetical protein
MRDKTIGYAALLDIYIGKGNFRPKDLAAAIV